MLFVEQWLIHQHGLPALATASQAADVIIIPFRIFLLTLSPSSPTIAPSRLGRGRLPEMQLRAERGAAPAGLGLITLPPGDASAAPADTTIRSASGLDFARG